MGVSELSACLCYILFMEVAHQLDDSPSGYRGAGIGRKFTLTATALIVVAALLGGTIGSARKSSCLSAAGTSNYYPEVDEIEKDYNEAVYAITLNYSGDIDYEKATQAAIQGMLSTLDPHSA